MLSKSPAFNLKAVLRETGLAADTLRAWERRYGVPNPQRTAGGHRLYSQYDIETIKWLIARQTEGLSISRAVDLWNEQNVNGDPLAAFAPMSNIVPQTISPNIAADTTLASIRNEWINACMNFSETHAEQALNKAFSMFPVEAVCIDLLQKGMSEIGALWYENRATVQQEHFASGLAMRRLDALLSASPTPTRAKMVLVGCPPNEWHTFTPLLLALLLRRRGLNVVYLGANVPAEHFAETAITIKADLVILTAQTLISAAHLQLTALALSSQGVNVAFGGRIFSMNPKVVDYIPGYFLGNAIEPSIMEIEQALKSKELNKSIKNSTQEFAVSLHAFQARRARIDATLRERIAPLNVAPENLQTGIHFLGDNIAAALQLGSLELLSEEMEWLKVLLQAHQRPQKELRFFMETYSQVVDEHINGQGDPIKKWLRAYSQERD